MIFFQPERYSRLIAGFIAYRDDLGFFFEDVLYAITGQKHNKQQDEGQNKTFSDVLKRNNDYVRQVLEFFEKNMKLLTCVPPPWFEKAIEVSDSELRKYFPEMADDDLRRKNELWESWQKHSDGD